jgi:RNA polymerase sigma factor (sigma-70 family)
MAEHNFQGMAEVFDEVIYIDTMSGEGVDTVLAKIDPLLSKKAASAFIPGFSFDDMKHELVLIAIDGIKKYDGSRDVKLSTFLYRHIENKLISRLRSENKLSNDAFSLSGKRQGDGKIKKAREEIGFSQFIAADGMEGISFESTISENNGLYFSDGNAYDKVEFEVSLRRLSKKLDYRTRRIIELIYFEDKSIKDAAKEVGLSGWAASMRLKKLAERHSFRSIFGIDENGDKEAVKPIGIPG